MTGYDSETFAVNRRFLAIWTAKKFLSRMCGGVRPLLTGTKRFGELKKSLTGVSQKVLTSQLREMEENGLVERKAYPEVPPRVEYSLTPLGRSLQPIMDAMRVWGEQYKQQNA